MTLHLLSPLDGRYAETTAPLRDHFSEFAFLRDRVHVELNFLPALSKTGLVRPLSDSESAHLESVLANFSDADAELILEYERKTRHDVKRLSTSSKARCHQRAVDDNNPTGQPQPYPLSDRCWVKYRQEQIRHRDTIP